jgi:hypothetical protein
MSKQARFLAMTGKAKLSLSLEAAATFVCTVLEHAQPFEPSQLNGTCITKVLRSALKATTQTEHTCIIMIGQVSVAFSLRIHGE